MPHGVEQIFNQHIDPWYDEALPPGFPISYFLVNDYSPASVLESKNIFDSDNAEYLISSGTNIEESKNESSSKVSNSSQPDDNEFHPFLSSSTLSLEIFSSPASNEEAKNEIQIVVNPSFLSCSNASEMLENVVLSSRRT